MLRRSFIVLGGVLAFLACAKPLGEHGFEVSDAGACPARPEILTGTTTPGNACSDARDCQPFCCSCVGDGGIEYLSAWCVFDSAALQGVQGSCAQGCPYSIALAQHVCP